MESFSNQIKSIQQKIMKKLINYTDSQYYLLKIKPTQNQYESKYLEIYQNTYLLHLIGVLGTIPSLIYFIRMRRLMKVPGFNEQQKLRLSKRCVFYLGFATSVTITATAYQYQNDFQSMTKQIKNSHRKQIQKGNLIAIDLSQ